MDESLEAPVRIHHFHCACVRERERDWTRCGLRASRTPTERKRRPFLSLKEVFGIASSRRRRGRPPPLSSTPQPKVRSGCGFSLSHEWKKKKKKKKKKKREGNVVVVVWSRVLLAHRQRDPTHEFSSSSSSDSLFHSLEQLSLRVHQPT